MRRFIPALFAASVVFIACAHAHGAPQATAGNVVAGCRMFPPGDFYNVDVTSVRPDAHSKEYIDGMIAAGNASKWDIEPGFETVNLANDATPLVTVHPKTAWHPFPRPFPWSGSFKIEPASDGHTIVLQTQRCHLYESYQMTYSGGMLSAYSGGDWDLHKPFVSAPDGPSSVASGLSILAGAVRWEEVQAGAIHHALFYIAPAHTVGDGTFTAPATRAESYAFHGSSAYQLPYGAKLRLKASFDTSKLGPQAKIVAQAMKTYGIVLSDTGCCNELVFLRALDGSNPWDQGDLDTISQIPISAFEVLPVGAITHV